MTLDRPAWARPGRLLAAALVGVCLVATAGGAHARDVFEVAGVAVDVTAETAAAAREQALAEGERQAFRRLLERLTLRADRELLPVLDRDEVATFVKDFSVAEEKTSPVRYIARLNYRFKAADVRDLLGAYAIPFAETPSKPLLVLPAYEAAGAQVLWDEPNPWREAWARRPATDGLVPMVLPIGDLADIAAIGVEQALSGDAARLADIGGRYGASDVLVARARLGLDPETARPGLVVTTTRYGAAGPENTVSAAFPAGGDEATSDLLARAAAAVAARLEEAWKEDNLLRFGRPAVAGFTVPIAGLADWLAVRRRLETVAVVRKLDVVLLSRREVRLNLHYVGDIDQLALALQQADLVMGRDERGLTLSPAAAPGPGKT